MCIYEYLQSNIEQSSKNLADLAGLLNKIGLVSLRRDYYFLDGAHGIVLAKLVYYIDDVRLRVRPLRYLRFYKPICRIVSLGPFRCF